MKPVLYRYRDSESVIKPLEGYTPGEGWEPLYDQAAVDAAVAAERERCSDAIMELGAELAKPVEPVEPAAWRTFDGEGGYMFRAYEDNEDYQEWLEKRNPHHKGWVEPLYLHPPTPAWHDAPTEPGIWLCFENGYAYTYPEEWDKGFAYGEDSRWYGPIPQDGEKS